MKEFIDFGRSGRSDDEVYSRPYMRQKPYGYYENNIIFSEVSWNSKSSK